MVRAVETLERELGIDRHLVSRGTGAGVVPEAAGSYATDAVEELLDLMGVSGGLRTAFRRYSPGDLVKTVYGVAVDDGWKKDKLAALDRIRDRILGSTDQPAE